MEEKKKRISYNASLSRWKALTDLATSNESSIQQLIDDAVDRVYFSASDAGGVAPPAPARHKHALEHEQCDAVLDSNFPDLKEALRANLKGWALVERLYRERPPERKPDGDGSDKPNRPNGPRKN